MMHGLAICQGCAGAALCAQVEWYRPETAHTVMPQSAPQEHHATKLFAYIDDICRPNAGRLFCLNTGP
jgi:hypothetical protein